MTSRVEMRQTVGEFIAGRYAWTHWFTLTYRDAVSMYRAERDLKTWLRSLARELLCAHVPVAWAIDLQRHGGAHIHVLLALPADISPSPTRLLESQWRYLIKGAGFTDGERYRPDKAAPFYMAGHAEWDMNVACPRTPQWFQARGAVRLNSVQRHRH